jgi:cystathionine gamma-synthase
LEPSDFDLSGAQSGAVFRVQRSNGTAFRLTGTGAVTPPIHPSTTFQRASDGSFASGYAYIRDGNPNRRALEQALAQIEGGASAIAFSSGMAATMAVFQALAPGDHVVAPLDAYFGTPKLSRNISSRGDFRFPSWT